MNPYSMVAYERGLQDRKWGGPAHDDEHSIEDWVEFINEYMDRIKCASEYPDRKKIQDSLIKIAALSIAAMESLERRFKDV